MIKEAEATALLDIGHSQADGVQGNDGFAHPLKNNYTTEMGVSKNPR